MTPAERKRAQRQREKLAGWAEVAVKVAAVHVDAVREFAAILPPPEPPTDPRQLSLIEQLDRALDGGASPSSSRERPTEQGSLF